RIGAAAPFRQLGSQKELRALFLFFSPRISRLPIVSREAVQKSSLRTSPLRTSHYGQFNRPQNVARSCLAPMHRMGPNGFFRSSVVSRRLPSDQLGIVDLPMCLP